ncbi:MAG: hypothetical protein Q9217_001088 [Psora testacea]
MSSQPHLQIFNSDLTTHNEESDFPIFPLLPNELRLKIWQHALQRQRIIKLCLKSRTEQTGTQAAEITEYASKRGRYCAVVDARQVLSKFLRVNRESREETLKFYRVHLPCSSTGGAGKGTTSAGTLHFNPEYDFLHISPTWPVKDTLLDFLYHLKTTHDPRHVGLLNLAVDINGLNGNDLHMLQPSDLDSEVRTAFVETLTQLHEVFFVSTPRVGRQIFGLMSGIPTSETFFNRSFPIMATAPSFERLHRDPRPIAQGLRKVFTGTVFLRDVLHLWLQLLKKWRISPLQIEYRFLLAFDPTMAGDPISDRASAHRWLQKEDDIWRNPSGSGSDESFFRKKKNVKWPIGASAEKFRDEDLEKAVRPAFGFWLFPVDVLGPLDGEGLSEEGGHLHSSMSKPSSSPNLNLKQQAPNTSEIRSIGLSAVLLEERE